jgi:hypothetical protein
MRLTLVIDLTVISIVVKAEIVTMPVRP